MVHPFTDEARRRGRHRYFSLLAVTETRDNPAYIRVRIEWGLSIGRGSTIIRTMGTLFNHVLFFCLLALDDRKTGKDRSQTTRICRTSTHTARAAVFVF